MPFHELLKSNKMCLTFQSKGAKSEINMINVKSQVKRAGENQEKVKTKQNL